MRSLLLVLAVSVLLAATAPALSARPADATKREAVASVDRHRDELVALSDQIWRFAETALHERRSSALLADYAERQGFKVERGVAGLPTAFVASYGEGRPIIGILGEYDALPGISQKAASVKEAAEPGAAGHGCGHNLFGAASLGAALAVKELIAAGKLKGTIRFYGTPAEESVGGKLYMAREGLFSDLDVCLAWHPSDEIQTDTESTQAIVDFRVHFKGRAAHAAFDPWNGRSAVDALELFTHGLNMAREHMRPTVRIHYAIVKGGDVPNVVPEEAELWCWIRDSKRAGVEEALERAKKMVEGAALMAGVEGRLVVQSGDYEMLPNFEGARLMQANLTWLGPLEFTADEQRFAREIQRATGTPETGLDGSIQTLVEKPGDPPGGSTDVADVSWIVPVIHLSVTTAPKAAPWHAWPVVACGGMSIGHRGLAYAAKALSATAVDLFEDAAARERIKAEFVKSTKGHVYKGYIPAGPPPLPVDGK